MAPGPLLHLLRLASPTLPVGAYAYSQGLEWAVEAGWLNPAPEQAKTEPVRDWLTGLLDYGLGHLELPALAHLIPAWHAGNTELLNQYNDIIRASRETAELLLEDEQMGAALARLLNAQNLPGADSLTRGPSYVSQFARACAHYQLPVTDAQQAFAYSWLENQIAAATKLIPLGQTEAQNLLMDMLPVVPAICERAKHIDPDEWGVSLPGLALASARHETQYCRLFRS